MTRPDRDEISRRFRAGLVLDGGLATELERRGHDLRDPLWSARVLLEEPEAVSAVHRDYLEAGAECLSSASYQATVPALERRGLSHQRAADLIQSSVRLARAVADEKPPCLVAASLGPYGAYLADGSEFCGDYRVSDEELRDFHSERLDLLIEAEPDVLACETVPALREAEILARLIESRGFPAWISFSCRDRERTCHGEPIEECARLLDAVSSVVAVGVNCTAPEFIADLTARIASATVKPIVVYPNGGQTWDAVTRSWQGSADVDRFVELARGWRSAGAASIGGCCQTTHEHIRRWAKARNE